MANYFDFPCNFTVRQAGGGGGARIVTFRIKKDAKRKQYVFFQLEAKKKGVFASFAFSESLNFT
jgi:hypothetical protein